jgi:uncharacterized SAM-binding protein YcdF (DUF218 family)
MPRLISTTPKNSLKRRRIKLIVGAAPLLAIATFMILTDREGHRDYAAQLKSPVDAIVILGARVEANGRASSALRERTLHAVDLWKQGRAPYLICTGGVGDFPPAESVVASRLAQKHGVPAAKVLCEEVSTTTRQNAHFAAEICRARGWTRVIIVSQAFHLPRAARNFRREGLQAWPSPVPDAFIDRSAISRWSWTARELLSSVRDLFTR